MQKESYVTDAYAKTWPDHAADFEAVCEHFTWQEWGRLSAYYADLAITHLLTDSDRKHFAWLAFSLAQAFENRQRPEFRALIGE